MQESKFMYLIYDSERKKTLIFYENDQFCEIKGKPEKILSKVCLPYGASFQQRRMFIKSYFNYQQKTPLFLDLKREVLFFPLFGKRSKENIWVQYQWVKRVKQKGSQACILFINGRVLTVPLHYRTIQKQMIRCKEIIKILSSI